MSTSVTRALQSIAILQASGIYLDMNQQRAIMEDVLRKKDRHRFLQASYKKQKQKSMEEDEQHVRRLRHEIKELQLQAEAISSVRQKTAALGFLLCIMAPDAASNPRYGAEAVLENWRRLSEYFGDIQLEISDLSKLAAADVLVATTTISIVLSDKTLRLAFPHLNSDRVGGLEGGEWSPTAIQLLGKKFVLHGSIQFDLDYASNRVTRIETQADMLSPILHILGNLDSVDQVFDGAVVTPDFGMIGKD
ncbi:bZIP transcription factor 1 [Phytophthora cinnamomi]|uniref:bZIP transcription factor 1 n=1 Tax=Phytophthora cinnamomi TaxID=4785 RepID=UPI00355941A5|nr:bZIP transcription factor 1 [Phytophthora cinnamomi]